jgi:AcrR family transcriptional regulator
MRGRPSSIREEEILDAARDVFREEGHAATTAKIAKRARVSQGILFYRYQSKEALLAAVIHRETQPPEQLRELVKGAGARGVVENLERIVDTLLDSVSRAHPFLELAMTSPMSGEIHKLLFAQTPKPPPQQIVELLGNYFEAEHHLGRVRAMDATAAARAIFGACIDYVRSGQAVQDHAGRSAFVRGLVDIVAYGALKTARSRQRR